MNDFLHKLPTFVGNNLALSALFVLILVALVALEFGRLLRKYKELTPGGLTLLILWFFMLLYWKVLPSPRPAAIPVHSAGPPAILNQG